MIARILTASPSMIPKVQVSPVRLLSLEAASAASRPSESLSAMLVAVPSRRVVG
jgi:hypothetical protein